MPPTRRRALVWLAILALPLLLGLCLQVDPARASLFGVEGPTCPVGSTFGEFACPGCGLTRSTALVMQGRCTEATAVHPAGWVVVLLCLVGCLVQGDIVRRGSRSAMHDRLVAWGPRVFVVGLVASWSLRLALH